MSEKPPVVMDYGSFQDPPSALFRDYLRGAPGIAPFYAGGRWDEAAVCEAAEHAAARDLPRQALARSLTRQQEERGVSGSAAARLAEPGSVAVVTGQQAVLFGGPLFVLYKALAVIELAARVEARTGRPAVPVFWVASDDHDFAEIRSVCLLDEAGRVRGLRYSPQREPVGQPASRVVLDDSIAGLVEEFATCLPAGAGRESVASRVAAAYRPGTTIAEAFAHLLANLFPELVVLDPADPALKAAMAPVFRQELAEGSPTSSLAREAGARLLAAGYHQQVPVRPGLLNLFLLVDGERRALAMQDGAIEVRGIGKVLPLDEVVRLVEAAVARFSPGVLLRPLAQDLALPTAAYVGGPAEIAYHAQIGPSYAHFGIPRPALVPRPGVTLVEAAQARALEAEGLGFAELQGDADAILAQWARQAYPDVEARFARAREALGREFGAIEEALGALDPTLRAAADSARGRALHQVDTLHEKALRALKKREQVRADRLRRTRDALFPGGSFQERSLAFVGLLARHGEGLIQELRRRVDPFAEGHQVIHL